MKTQIITPLRACRVAATFFVAVLASALFIASASAQTIIYSDDFTHAAGDLNGNTVQTSSGLFGGTSGATWLSGTGQSSGTPVFNYTGSGAVSNDTDFASTYYAFLPLTLETGVVYSLQVDIAPTTLLDSSSFLGIGFAANTNTTNPAQSGHSPWVKYFGTSTYSMAVKNRFDGGCAPPSPAPLAAAGVRGES